MMCAIEAAKDQAVIYRGDELTGGCAEVARSSSMRTDMPILDDEAFVLTSIE